MYIYISIYICIIQLYTYIYNDIYTYIYVHVMMEKYVHIYIYISCSICLSLYNHPFSYHWQQTGKSPGFAGDCHWHQPWLGMVGLPYHLYTYGDDWGMVNMDVNMAGANGCFNGIVWPTKNRVNGLSSDVQNYMDKRFNRCPPKKEHVYQWDIKIICWCQNSSISQPAKRRSIIHRTDICQ